MKKNSTNKFDVLHKAEFLVKLINNQDSEDLISELNAFQLQKLRDFLESELLFLSSYNGERLTREQIKSNYKPIPDYYYNYDCRESLDSCYNEACLASNPNCFSRKMKEQIRITLDLLEQHLRKEKKQELEVEKL
jgi:hypothetical protein